MLVYGGRRGDNTHSEDIHVLGECGLSTVMRDLKLNKVTVRGQVTIAGTFLIREIMKFNPLAK